MTLYLYTLLIHETVTTLPAYSFTKNHAWTVFCLQSINPLLLRLFPAVSLQNSSWWFPCLHTSECFLRTNLEKCQIHLMYRQAAAEQDREGPWLASPVVEVVLAGTPIAVPGENQPLQGWLPRLQQRLGLFLSTVRFQCGAPSTLPVRKSWWFVFMNVLRTGLG